SMIENGKASVLAVFGGATSRPNESRVLALALGPEGRVWMACTYYGLASLETDGSVRRYRLGDPSLQQVSAVVADKTGRLWVGSNTGLWVGDENGFEKVDEPGMPENLVVRSLAILGDDELWMGTYREGAVVRHRGQWRSVRHDGPWVWNSVYSLSRDSVTGETLLGTRAGLAVVQGDALVPFDRDGLSVRIPVYFVFENDNELWVGTQRGVICWDGKETSTYTVQQGLAGNETNRAAVCVDSLGCVWFGTVNGASCYRAEFDQVELLAPSLRFHGVDVAGEQFSLEQPLHLNYDSNDLVFSMKAVSFAEADALDYECRLDGFDDLWLPSSAVVAGSIRYTSLPPGTYRLWARARSHRGPWSEPVSSAVIVIARAWWTTWWANLLGGLALCSVGWGVSLLMGARRRNRQLEDVVDERTRDLRAAEERYRGMFDKNLAPQLLVDSSTGAILAVNQAAEEHYSQAAADLLGTTFVDVFGDDEGALRDGLRDLQPGEPLRLSSRQRIDGDSLHVEVHACTYELHGSPMIHATVFDVTEHRLMEEQLRQAQRMESVGRLAGGVAHDFNNLLTAVLGHAEMALLELDDKGAVTEHLDVVAAAAVRGARLTTQLLSFARQQPSAPRRLDIDEQLRNLDPVLRGLLREDIELRVVLAGGGAGVLIDPGQLEQVLLNLVVNSVDAMPKGGNITLATRRLSATEATLLLGSAPETEDAQTEEPDLSGLPLLCLSVQDTGVGMSAETLARIFEPFFTTKGVGEGTGLGLAMCDGLVRQNGGRLLVQTSPGEGTCFEIYLPAQRGPLARVAEIAPEPPVAGAETILLVEDDNAVREVACKTLRRLDYKVLQAADGEDALKVCREYDGVIDLLVTDVIMPRLGGPDLALQLSQQIPGLAVLFVSGYTANALDAQGMSWDEIDLLEKPFHTDELARRVRASLERRAALNHGKVC
ncbi:MAG: PAS domain S-box-containing protein, partial [Pseudohongiellaceae bacterium]